MPVFIISTDIAGAPLQAITAQDIDLALDIAIARARSRNHGAECMPWAVPFETAHPRWRDLALQQSQQEKAA